VWTEVRSGGTNGKRSDELDQLAHEKPRSEERRRALDRMLEIAEEAGMYDQTVLPKRTR
jgi:hypothetical protein